MKLTLYFPPSADPPHLLPAPYVLLLSGDDTIGCPYVFKKPGSAGAGIEVVVRFGKSTAGHPKVHMPIQLVTIHDISCRVSVFLVAKFSDLLHM